MTIGGFCEYALEVSVLDLSLIQKGICWGAIKALPLHHRAAERPGLEHARSMYVVDILLESNTVVAGTKRRPMVGLCSLKM